MLIFPEGTRMAPGETRKYGVSGALLATKPGGWSCRSRTTRVTSGRAAGC